MAEDRIRIGAFISTIGAAALGLSVFLPWYALTLTASGAASAQQALNSAAQQFGNASFQAQANSVGAGFSSAAIVVGGLWPTGASRAVNSSEQLWGGS
jgi:hypothetical protein